jgi:hypothetical protein
MLDYILNKLVSGNIKKISSYSFVQFIHLWLRYILYGE